MIRKLQLALIILVFGFGITGITAQANLKKANKQFDLRAFELAAYNYEQVIKEDSENSEAMISLAQCYTAMTNDLKASKLFEKASEKVLLSPGEQLLYGKTLMKLADYSGAKRVFNELSITDPITAEHYLLSCDYAEKMLKLPITYDISPFGGNTENSDFGLTSYDDSWVYVSFRNDLKEKKTKKVPGSKLFSTGEITSSHTSVSLLRAPIRSSYRLGPVSYSQDLSQVAVMKNDFKEGHQPIYEGNEDQSIIIADVDINGDFINERPFKHNEIGSSTAFPSLAFTNSALYFSSNRSGGFGGYDLYVSYYIDGEWTLPENLGENINSPGNEITPYFDDHLLYFASDYHHGLGGYDIFKSIVYNGQWSFAENLGNGVNSPSDDMYPFMKRGGKKIYFSSNRLGSKGYMDIFTATRTGEDLYAVETMEPQVPVVAMVVNDEAKVQSLNTDDLVSKDYFNVEEENDLISKISSLENETTGDNSIDKSISPSKIDDKPKPLVLENLKVPTRSSYPNWEGAKIVGFNESLLNGTKVYFIQVAALSRTNGNPVAFERLTKYGNIYRMNQSNLIKIRLGYFLDESEAKEVLRTVKNNGYKDAFITYQTLNTSEMELILSNDNLSGSDSYMVPSKFKGTSNYKVRLASYEDPIWFDISKAKDLGKIEQWTKGGWTIFILSGYKDVEDAERARIRAVNKGFADAEIVYDNDGILERLKKN